MTRSELVEKLVLQSPGLSKRDMENLINTVFDTMTLALAKHDRIEIRGFGTFVAKKRMARNARNPRTGDQVKVSTKWVPFFTAGKELRDRVNSGGNSMHSPSSVPKLSSWNTK